MGLLPTGCVLGLLCGVGVIPGGAGLLLIYGGPVLFVPWAVAQLDARELEELEIYNRESDG
jgi:hypothetical protein